jgi:hypothetical protein
MALDPAGYRAVMALVRDGFIARVAPCALRCDVAELHPVAVGRWRESRWPGNRCLAALAATREVSDTTLSRMASTVGRRL